MLTYNASNLISLCVRMFVCWRVELHTGCVNTRFVASDGPWDETKKRPARESGALGFARLVFRFASSL